MSGQPVNLKVIDNTEQNRFEARVAEQLAIADYRVVDNVMTFTHTEVPTEFRSQGIGQQLAHGALQLARKRGVKVKPLCPFIADYIERNPEFKDLLA